MTACEPPGSRLRAVLTVLVALSALTAGCSTLAGPGDGGGEIRFENATEGSGLTYADAREKGVGNGNAGVYVADADRSFR